MQKQSNEKYNFWAYESYGTRLIKGVTRDQVIKELSRYPLLMKHYKKNEAQFQTRIIDTLMREPSPSDCPGFIYGFKDYHEHNKNPYSESYEIKMGRTKRQVPQNRIYEWEDADGHQYVELFTIRSEYNNKLQSLVHLFFAYARKLKIINGKRRIEWFTFQENALNAAATALINQLMQKVHHFGKISSIEKLKPSYDLNEFCSEINEEVLSIEFLKKRLIIVGLRQSGKSVLKAMLNGQELKVTQGTEFKVMFETQKTLQIQLPNAVDSVQNIIELFQDFSLTPMHVIDSLQLLNKFKNSFMLWSNINSVEEIAIPCLIVTQNDLLSSEMFGFRKALQNLLQFIKIAPQFDHQNSQKNVSKSILDEMSKFKLFLVVSKIQNGRLYTEQKIKKYIHLNKNLFSSYEFTILQKSSIFFIPAAQQQGKMDYNVERIIRQIHNYNFNQMKSISFEYFDQKLTKICEETVNFAYEEVGQKIEGYFKSALKRVAQNHEIERSLAELELNKKEDNEENDQRSAANLLQLATKKLKFIESVENILNNLKSATKQQQVLLNLKKMHILLSVQGKDITMSQLIVFCECMLKLSTLNDSQDENNDDIDKKQTNSQVLSPIYLQNSLLFSNLSERINHSKEDIREQVNSIIQNELKMGLQTVVGRFYDTLNENTHQNKVLFGKVYDVLFRMMNIDSTIVSERAEKKLSQEMVENQVLEEQILIKCVDELLGLSGGEGSVYCEQFRLVIKMLTLIYTVQREYKIRTSSVVSRIREAIYILTKGKKQVPMVNTNTDQSNDTNQEQKGYSKKSYQNYNNKPNHIQIDSQTKMILNKKNEAKNQRLLNFINAKKKYIEESMQEENKRQREINVNSSNNRVQTRSVRVQEEKTQMTLVVKEKHSVIEISDEEGESIYPSLKEEKISVKKQPEMSSQEEFFSMPESISDQEKKSTKTEEISVPQVQIMNSEPSCSMQQTLPMIDQGQYSTFVHNLMNSFSSVKQKYCSIPSLKSLNDMVLFKILAQQNYYEYTFNFLQNTFCFDLPSITLHNSFVIIFAKKVVVSNICEINFKIHYKNRKPNKVNLIIIAEGYDGTQKLKIQDNKFGKVLMVEVTKKNDRKFKVLDGYYTKNKRNEKRLEDLKIHDLVESYCKIIN